jgi:hypothetical protein
MSKYQVDNLEIIMIKRALIVGINYVGTGNDLRGCINDAKNMQTLLAGRGFDQIEMLLEKDATTAGIKAALERLVTGVSPGDVIVFHYSGHGSQLPSKTEADGFEEIICPIDLNWTTRVITDADLKKVFNTVPKGVNTTLILDCCHAGDALNQDIGDSVGTAPATKSLAPPVADDDRYLTPPTMVAATLEDSVLVDWRVERDVNNSALLIAGSHANQTSADACIDGMYQGAATYALLRAVKMNPTASYKELIDSMTAFMIADGYTQRPELNGYPGLYTEIFAEPFGSADAVPASTTEPTIAVSPQAPVTVSAAMGLVMSTTAGASVVNAPGGMDRMTMLVLAIVVITAIMFFMR